jgi:OPA family glycerol-3-phosphate transporter-like MFS transporter/OPA family sugar phosphate sensor protein UhpC-like MFS transporter
MPVASGGASAWLRLFKPAPAQPSLLTNPSDIAAGYRAWQRRVLVATIVGYATFYFVRKNLSVAMAVGLTGFFGYASTLLSGWGLGSLVQHHGWNAGFAGMIIVPVMATVLFVLAWPARAHGYVIEPGPTEMR